MSQNNQRASLEKVFWQGDIRKSVERVNPELAKVINDIKPGKDLPFYLAKYPFGANMSIGNTVYLPTPSGNVVPITDPQISQEIQNDLGYTGTMPIGLPLQHSIELCVKSDDGILPWVLIMPGRVFGLWKGLETEPGVSYHGDHIWHMAAGMLSGFILPSFADSVAYKKLAKSRGLRRFLPRNMKEHCAMLTQMSQHKDFPQQWQNEILYFTSSWYKKLASLPSLELYFYKNVISKTKFWRNKVIFDFIWDSFIKNLHRENIIIKPHIIDIVKQILIIALGELPGFAPAVDDEVAPVTGIQDDLLNIYKLKNFSSTIMVPAYFNFHDPNTRPVYWSLQLPYYFESAPRTRSTGTLLENLVQIEQLIRHFCVATETDKLSGMANTPIAECIKKVKFTCFHSDIDTEGLIQHIHKMPKEDPSLLSFPISENYHQKGFSDTTPFARGCIRISLK